MNENIKVAGLVMAFLITCFCGSVFAQGLDADINTVVLDSLVFEASAASSVQVGNPIVISATIINQGTINWPVNIENHVFRFRTPRVTLNFDNGSTQVITDVGGFGFDLPHPVEKNGGIANMIIEIPTGEGHSINNCVSVDIELQMVKEGIAWFGDKEIMHIDLVSGSSGGGSGAGGTEEMGSKNDEETGLPD